MDSLLIVDSSDSLNRGILNLLSGTYSLVYARSGGEALELLSTEEHTSVLLNFQLSDMSGVHLLQKIHREIGSHVRVIMVTTGAEVDQIVEAMRAGAADVIERESEPDAILLRLMETFSSAAHSAAPQSHAHQADEKRAFIFVSGSMKKVNLEMTRLARTNFDVLLLGETGVGKDLVATQLYLRSTRSEKPFLSVSMRTLNETLIESELFGHERGAFSGAERAKTGKFEAASGGTIFIPEISSLSEAIQLKLLYFLQYKRISRVGQDAKSSEIPLDVRLIMATNDNLPDLVEKGILREDFYHRIAGVQLHIPPLRERVDDILPLAEYFVDLHSGYPGGRRYEIAPEVRKAMLSYHWPGNVRELENAVKHALAFSSGRLLGTHDFPRLCDSSDRLPPGLIEPAESHDSIQPYAEAMLEFKRSYFQRLLPQAQGNVAKAAELAKMTPQGIRRILNSFQLRR
jgi:two-component system response regulator AtoC